MYEKFQFLKNSDFGQIFEKFQFWSKFSKIFDSNQIIEKISILVKIFEKFRL